MYISPQDLEAQMPDATQLMSNEPEMESTLHYNQLLLLVSCLEWLWLGRNDFFIGANLTVYFSREQLRNQDFRGPDFFLVKQTQKRDRNSWVVWEESGKYPDLIIELLSTSTAKIDRTLKKELYQDRFRTPEYFYFSPETLELKGYRLMGNKYQEINPESRSYLWSEVLGLYLGIAAGKLRYFTWEGVCVPTPEECATDERLQKEIAQQQLEQERLQTLQLKEKLRSLGVDPEKL